MSLNLPDRATRTVPDFLSSYALLLILTHLFLMDSTVGKLKRCISAIAPHAENHTHIDHQLSFIALTDLIYMDSTVGNML